MLALIFAAMEIEIEGKWGWMQKTQTWYLFSGGLAAFWQVLVGPKPITGYHFFFSIFQILILHIPFVSGAEWSLAREFMTLSVFFVWSVLEDFLWFVLNPYYGIKNFRKEKIWWYAKNVWIIKNRVPALYLKSAALSFACSVAATLLDPTNYSWWTYPKFSFYLALLIVTTVIVIAPLYKKWYHEIRKFDERGKLNLPPDET
jgi:hypothetical protein